MKPPVNLGLVAACCAALLLASTLFSHTVALRLTLLGWSVELERSSRELRNEVLYTGLALWTCHVAAQARPAPRIILPTVAAVAALLCGLALTFD
jgi:hypothetical protein